MERTVLVLGKVHDAGLERLRAHGFTLIERPDDPADLLSVAAVAEAIIVRTTPIGAAVVDHAPGLRLVARHGVGYDAVDVAALSRRGIPLALTGDVNSTAVAEHALALMLASAKHLTVYDKAVREGRFDIRDRFDAIELAGRSVLVVGLGRIGSKVVRLCQAFAMDVVGCDPYADRERMKRLGVRLVEDWHAVLGDVDFVTLHVPKLASGRPLVGASEIAAMKPGAVLVNVSRGGLVDEDALCRAVASGRLRGAGVDVFATEPLPAEHPLAGVPDIVLSPHSAAFTRECVRRMSMACAENVIAFANGSLDRDLVVNKEVLAAPPSGLGRAGG